IPFLAVLWVLAAWGATAATTQFGWLLNLPGPDDTTYTINLGPLAVISVGMLLAAFIDGYAFKVPNWVTLSLVMSGWYIGLLHDFGSFAIPGITPGLYGGFLSAFGLTVLGFALLFPALFIGGMGQGDVKMTMGFGSWLGAYFGFWLGASVLWWSFAVGVLIGGVFGVVIMLLRGRLDKNVSNAKEIMIDLQVLAMQGHEAARKRANARRPEWWRLPYGVPLCAGFLGYLWFIFFVNV
ncbi:MAG: prepilin peptidase, partial [Fimbriiglobus sp.]